MPAFVNVSRRPSLIVDPVPQFGAKDFTEAVLDGPAVIGGKLLLGCVRPDLDPRTTTPSDVLESDVDGSNHGIQPRPQDHQARTVSFGDFRNQFSRSQNEPSVALIDDCVIHHGIMWGVLVSPANDGVFGWGSGHSRSPSGGEPKMARLRQNGSEPAPPGLLVGDGARLILGSPPDRNRFSSKPRIGGARATLDRQNGLSCEDRPPAHASVRQCL